MNRTFAPGHAQVMYRGLRCHQIFDLNYGIVDYVDFATYPANTKQLPNPITHRDAMFAV
jgi:hypothetical protein